MKSAALKLWAEAAAPVLNDGEKRARATTQVDEVARERDRSDVGDSALWAVRDRATLITWVRHGTAGLPHGTCRLSHTQFAPRFGPSRRVGTLKSLEAIPLVYLRDFGTPTRIKNRLLAELTPAGFGGEPIRLTKDVDLG